MLHDAAGHEPLFGGHHHAGVQVCLPEPALCFALILAQGGQGSMLSPVDGRLLVRERRAPHHVSPRDMEIEMRGWVRGKTE